MSLVVDIKKNFKGFSLHVAFQTDGQRLGILGPSGSGKTMTLKMIAGIENPDEGYISLNGRTLFDSSKKINLNPQRRRVGYLFQQFALFPNMTVWQNIECGLMDKETQERTRTIEEMVNRFQLMELENRYPYQLSGGQQQRVALARCLAANPELVLLDEPLSALDAYLREQMTLEMNEYLNQFSGESIIVSHSRYEISALCPSLLVLDKGKDIGYGRTMNLFSKPQSMRVAQLTGCKNISPIERLDDHTLVASKWGIPFHTKKAIPPGITHVGIRAHDIVPAEFDEKEANEFDGKVRKIFENQEGLMGTTILIDTFPGTKNPLWCKVNQDRWSQIKAEIQQNRFIVKEENLLLLIDEEQRINTDGGTNETN